MQWQDATHGQFVLAEVVVLETANGETAMSLSSGDSVEAFGENISNRTAVVAGFAVNSTGIATSRDFDGDTNDTALLADDEYLYLTNDTSSAVDFTQGKLLVRLVGVDTTWGF